MKSKLTILINATTVLLLCAPMVVWASESRQLPTLQPFQFPTAQAPAIQFPAAQVPDEELNRKFVLILKLDDEKINKLRLNRSLDIQIPMRFVNRVGAIRFQRTVSFLSNPLKVVGAKTSKNNQAMSVEIDNTILERLAYQPVDVAIYESGFQQVQLKFNPLGTVAGKLPAEVQPRTSRSDGPYMYVRINSQRGIYGRLKNFKTLSIKTQFGKVKVPTEEIAGIRFNDSKSNRAFVVLKKGDVFSGEIDMSSITIKSRWGNRRLQLRELESLTLAREIVFLRDALKPDRWRLESMLPKTAVAPIAPNVPVMPNSVLNTNLPVPIQPAPFVNDPFRLNLAPPLVYPQPQAPVGFPN